jgi:hypothetical protein
MIAIKGATYEVADTIGAYFPTPNYEDRIRLVSDPTPQQKLKF